MFDSLIQRINLPVLRPPDFVIGTQEDPYLRRWHLLPMNKWFNLYLHHFLRSDDPRALHDHPWWNVSVILRGGYWEHLPINGDMQKTRRVWRWPFIPYLRSALAAHRIELDLPFSGPVWSLFFTGPKIRSWGFWCPKGWVPWRAYTTGPDSSLIGRGCDALEEESHG